CGDRLAVGTDIVAERQHQIGHAERDEQKGNHRIPRNAIGPGSSWLTASKHQDGERIGGVKEPTDKNQRVGKRVESAAAKEKNAPDSLHDERRPWCVEARMRATQQRGKS